MTPKKKMLSNNQPGQDADLADSDLTSTIKMAMGSQAPTIPPATASIVAQVTTSAAASASSMPGSVTAAVREVAGNLPRPHRRPLRPSRRRSSSLR